MQSKQENTITCSAKILSPPICLAIWNDETATGEPNTNNNVNNSIPLNPKITDIGIKIRGTKINFPKTTKVVFFK